MNILKRYREQLGQLVALPSVSSPSPQWDMPNQAVIELLASWLDDLGFSTEIMPLPGKPGKANLIATLGRGSGGLVLAGHADTVPYDEGRWQQDPFTLTEKEGRLYGLGATDMKGFFPLAIAAAAQFAGPNSSQLKQPLIILATADEESSMDGARLLTQVDRPKARYAVVGEPTGLRPVRMHKGIMMEAVRITGQSGHSSNPSLGNNAMEAMHLVLGELLAFRQELQAQYRDPGFEVDMPTLNLGHIHGGDSPNRICGHCELHFDLRPLPGMRVTELRELIDKRLEPIRHQTGTQIHCEALIGGVEPFEEAADSLLVQTVEKLTGHHAESVAFATEAPFMQELGMQTLVWGPGSIDQAHQPDEFIALDQIEPALTALSGLIHRLCL